MLSHDIKVIVFEHLICIFTYKYIYIYVFEFNNIYICFVVVSVYSSSLIHIIYNAFELSASIQDSCERSRYICIYIYLFFVYHIFIETCV